jgi:hypothetical protein
MAFETRLGTFSKNIIQELCGNWIPEGFYVAQLEVLHTSSPQMLIPLHK